MDSIIDQYWNIIGASLIISTNLMMDSWVKSLQIYENIKRG